MIARILILIYSLTGFASNAHSQEIKSQAVMPSQAAPKSGWEGEWRCEMSFDSSGHLADGSLYYILEIEKHNSDYTGTLTIEGSLDWGKLDVCAHEIKNQLIVIFSKYTFDDVTRIGSFKKGDILFVLHKIKNKVITRWRLFKPEKYELRGWLVPGEHFVRK